MKEPNWKAVFFVTSHPSMSDHVRKKLPDSRFKLKIQINFVDFTHSIRSSRSDQVDPMLLPDLREQVTALSELNEAAPPDSSRLSKDAFRMPKSNKIAITKIFPRSNLPGLISLSV